MWLEHVDSRANPTDGGSRVGVSDPLAAALGVELKAVPFPPWPADVLNFSPDAWCELLGV